MGEGVLFTHLECEMPNCEIDHATDGERARQIRNRSQQKALSAVTKRHHIETDKSSFLR